MLFISSCVYICECVYSVYINIHNLDGKVQGILPFQMKSTFYEWKKGTVVSVGSIVPRIG